LTPRSKIVEKIFPHTASVDDKINMGRMTDAWFSVKLILTSHASFIHRSLPNRMVIHAGIFKEIWRIRSKYEDETHPAGL
jgi:hypothetical protein